MNKLSFSPDVETIVIGAGVIGLAIARELAISGQEVIVLEQHGLIGSETSSRNSEVIHAGIYYPKDSLKARTCVEGKNRLYDFCQSHGIPHRQLGKLIVATHEHQQEELSRIANHALQNGVDDLRLLNDAELRQMEPALTGVAALFSPSTGIIDTHAYMLALQGDAEADGCQIAFNTKASSWQILDGGGFEIRCGEGTNLTCKNLIVSGGLHTSQFIQSAATRAENLQTSTHYAKGNYFRLTGEAPFSHLIYPVPEPGGLGVHLTLDMGNQARFGPDVEWVEELDYEVDPARSDKFYAAIRSYWPDLGDRTLEPDYAGIRPKISAPGQENADFKITGPLDHGCQGLVILSGIESPGLTASLSIASIAKEKLHAQCTA